MIKPPNLVGLDEARRSDENLNISASKLCKFFPPQLQLMSNKRWYLCGCGFFILDISLQSSINVQRLIIKKYGDDMRMNFFDNMAKMYVTYSKIKGKISNDQK